MQLHVPSRWPACTRAGTAHACLGYSACPQMHLHVASMTCTHHELTHVVLAYAAAATWSDAGSGQGAVDASHLVQALSQKLGSRKPAGTAHVHAYTATVMHSILDTT